MTALRYVSLPHPGDVPSADIIGGKAYNLARLASVAGARVPAWFSVTASAFDEFVMPAWNTRGARSVEDVFGAFTLPVVLRRELTEAIAARGLGDAVLAVRSSATAEDAAATSFAGQFATVLGVRATEDLTEVWRAILSVWQSAFSAHAVAYAKEHAATVRMAVVIQALVPARAAGVAFSVDPVSGDRSRAVVSAVHGLGELLVSGESDADTYHVVADRVAREEIAEKRVALYRTASGAVERVDVAEAMTRAPAITHTQAIAIAALARRLEGEFGAPQDIEWVVAPTDGAPGDVLHLLQSRPITAIARPASGERRIWDNSNIIESYSGVTTPLTFSFARGVYEQVYRQFLDVLGVAPEVIESRRHILANMLGLIQGRVYYHLLNWYRVLAVLPGYALNRQFMERMMGVREVLADPPPPAGTGERWRDGGRLVRMGWRLWSEHHRIEAHVADFLARVERTLGPLERESLDAWDAGRLVTLYRELEDALLLHWRAPLVNDFFAMIWFGTLGRLVERWLPASAPTLVNDLLVGEGGIISTEPARRISALARVVAEDDALRARFATETDDTRLLHEIRESPRFSAFSSAVDAYLAKFGDRCVGELKLETIPPTEEPQFVIRMVRAYVAQGLVGREGDASDAGTREASIRAGAESEVRTRLGIARAAMFFYVLRQARARVRDRENLRFERTRVFGTVRRILRTIGVRLHEAGRLGTPRQVFHLTVEEVFAAVAGTGATHDLGRLATQRQEEFARYESEAPPPDRFETIGVPVPPRPRATAVPTGTMRGLGCCPGIVRAPVRVVHDPAHAGDLAGHILVAERTDPGWTLLFPTASGLLVQRGSLLSHSAIVAREIGLPCVVALPGLMLALQDGEIVEMDGSTGEVRRVASA